MYGEGFSLLIRKEKEEVLRHLSHVKSWMENYELCSLTPKSVEQTWKKHMRLGIFLIFSIRRFSCQYSPLECSGPERCGFPLKITLLLLYAYIGLEIAVSMLRVKVINYKWSNKDNDVAVVNPLWHCRHMVQKFI